MEAVFSAGSWKEGTQNRTPKLTQETVQSQQSISVIMPQRFHGSVLIAQPYIFCLINGGNPLPPPHMSQRGKLTDQLVQVPSTNDKEESTVKSQILSALPGHTVITQQKNLMEPLFIVVQSLSCIQIFRDPHGLQPSRLLCPWDFLGRNTGVGCQFLTQGSNQCFLHCR